MSKLPTDAPLIQEQNQPGCVWTRMSLREQLAGQALSAIIWSRESMGIEDPELAAKSAVVYADALLKELQMTDGTARMLLAIDRLNDIVHPMRNSRNLSERQRKALRDIEELLEQRPSDIDEARELMQHIQEKVQDALGGPLAVDVVGEQ